jgi:hypothetical protein
LRTKLGSGAFLELGQIALRTSVREWN